MREIKFRAWDKKNKRMEEIDGGNLYIADGKIYEVSEETHYYDTYMSKKDVTENYILMQYTGLKDKSGTEIYEGDIVKREFCHYQNIFDPYTLGFVDSEIEGEGHWIGVIKYLPSCGFVMDKVVEVDEYNESKKQVRRKNVVQYKSEVIGNLYDNPELVGGNRED